MAAHGLPSLMMIFAHLDLPTTLPQPAAARAPPWSNDELDQGELEFHDGSDQDVLHARLHL
jgi:hypothetical protein